jgi:hypothetical protein
MGLGHVPGKGRTPTCDPSTASTHKGRLLSHLAHPSHQEPAILPLRACHYYYRITTLKYV